MRLHRRGELFAGARTSRTRPMTRTLGCHRRRSPSLRPRHSMLLGLNAWRTWMRMPSTSPVLALADHGDGGVEDDAAEEEDQEDQEEMEEDQGEEKEDQED
mmetsp:Transcript_12998/g.27480  ORF Transcript_12998/g.27480 Transcript_12998/m.27480 type:complete len:101 (-) Transcript_12998:27-329(-)